jgi:hypothetical protein
MTFDQKTLYELLPAIYRIRDAEQGQPLLALMQVLSEQVGVLEENLAQLYDDQFAETSASWVLPYLGDLLGIRGLTSSGPLSSRSEVAHTIGYRRRKGTAAMLEQLARDVTGWPARAVEFFELIAATQYMNHLRPANQSFVCVRDARRLEDLGGPFERATQIEDPDLTHTVDVRRISSGHGRYNIPNVGLFLWRLRAMSLTRSPAVPATPGDKRKFFFSPLGIDLPLFNSPKTESVATHLAEPVNVPDRIRRRVLDRNFDDYYGRSLKLELAPSGGGDPVPAPAPIVVCDLSGWTNLPTNKIAIDPVLGRIAFPDDQPETVLASFHYGFSANMGGGEYSRLLSTDGQNLDLVKVVTPDTIAAALTALGPNGGTVEIGNSGRYSEVLAINAATRFIEVRAGDKRRPTIVLGSELTITGTADDDVILDGLLLTGAGIRVTGALRKLILRHCTLVPGISLLANGDPAQPGVPSLIVEPQNTSIVIDHCILGGIRTDASNEVAINDSIVDATSDVLTAYSGTKDFGAPLRITNSTVIGQVRTSIMRLASNTIFIASIANKDPAAPVLAERRQEGCVRFSYLSPKARVPARYHCQPAPDDSLIRPQFVSTHFKDPGYCQLSVSCPAEIRAGADDESSMGAFHDLFEPQRESRLRTSLEEYLRFGLEAGIFYVT